MRVILFCRDTYGYFGASLGLTAASAGAIFKTPALLNIVARGGFVALGVSLAAVIGTGMVVRSIPYDQGLGKKQLAWALHVRIYHVDAIKLLTFIQSSVARVCKTMFLSF